MSQVELFSPGSLGTCWYGHYHYMEPWVGCQHACPYCYARSRVAVNNSLEQLGTTFAEPALIMPEDKLLEAISEKANSGDIDILKLCRFTDIFTAKYVENGLAYEILKILANSKIDRVIITTKGLPDEPLLKLMADHRKVFSYNAAFRPSMVMDNSPLSGFDTNLKPYRQRLEAAARLKRDGLQTTIHLDPFVAGIDDDDEALLIFISMLKELGLNRVMWSYLLFSDGIMDSMKEAVPAEELQRIMERYDFSGARKVLPGQEDTVSFAQRNEVALESVDKVATALMAGGLEFVLCSLKSVRGLNLKKYPRTMLCDGTFYA